MKQLGQLEAAVMDRLWGWARPASVREVLEDLQQDRDIAYTTVMTVLDNLHTKGFVVREKVGRAFAYRPATTREEHAAGLLEMVLADSPDRGATLLTFVGHLSPADQAELRAALEDSPGTDTSR